MLIERRSATSPFFSICIPQYNRTSFLLEVCKSLEEQSYRDFEVCISDDCSTDGRESELLAFLERLSFPYAYQRQPANLRYDGNLRASMQLARGKYLFLLGNDDVLKNADTLRQVAAQLHAWDNIGVLFTNYEDYASGITYPRVHESGVLGTGPEMAVHHFRNFSFVSGIVLDRAASERHITRKWDGSEMYQMYIGCRIIAEGLLLASLNLTTIRKDVQVEGEQVDSYATLTRKNPDVKKAQNLPLIRLAGLVNDSIVPFVSSGQATQLLEKIVRYVYLFPYLFWLLEYRRVQSWWYAYNVAIGMHPTRVLQGIPVSGWLRVRVLLLYVCITLGGLLFPVSLFQRGVRTLHGIAKRVRL